MFKQLIYTYYTFRRNVIHDELNSFLNNIDNDNVKITPKEEQYFNTRLQKMLYFSNKALKQKN